MFKEFGMPKNIKSVLTLISLTVLYMACATIDYTSMNFDTNITPPKILNLRNCGIITRSEAIDTEQADKIVKNWLFSGSSGEYGFYHINFEYSKDMTIGGAFLGLLNIYTFAVPTLAGVPLTIDKYITKLNFEVFNSNGILVKKYQEAFSFKHYTGLYYGYNLNKKANKIYIQLLTKIMEQASRDSEEINEKLSGAGQITEYDQNIINKIYLYIAQQYSAVQFSKQIQLPGYIYNEKNGRQVVINTIPEF
jgi:hypothetical protein